MSTYISNDESHSHEANQEQPQKLKFTPRQDFLENRGGKYREINDFKDNHRLIYHDDNGLEVYALSDNQNNVVGIGFLHSAGHWGQWGWYLSRPMAERFCINILLCKGYATDKSPIYSDNKTWNAAGTFDLEHIGYDSTSDNWVGSFSSSTFVIKYMGQNYFSYIDLYKSYKKASEKKKNRMHNPAGQEDIREQCDFIFFSDIDAFRLALSILDSLGDSSWVNAIYRYGDNLAKEKLKRQAIAFLFIIAFSTVLTLLLTFAQQIINK